MISAEDTQLQLKTLQEISAELDQHGLEVADSGTLGISVENGDLWVTMTMLSPGKHAELALVEGKVKVAEGIDGDVRPLYIVPFDPAAAPDQHADERDYCARELTERILIFAMSRVGRAAVPDIVSLDPIDAMKQATWSLSDKWATHEVEQLRRRIEDELYRTLYRGMPDKVEREGRKVHVNLVTQEDQRTALSVLQKSRPQYIAERLLDPQLPLLDPGPA
ncbi:hypothetical protein ACGFJ4_14605 [Micromonospora chalcea]|uniref:hypothetical protein n=1 Tax=Micromonospora chalcea TaxID=1874 RepID=UPI00340218FB